MNSEFQGIYWDGVTATRQTCTVCLKETGIHIKIQDRDILIWPYNEIRKAESFEKEDPTQLERGPENEDTLIVPDPNFATEIDKIFSKPGWKDAYGRNIQIRRSVTITAFLISLFLLSVLYFLFLPYITTFAAFHVPISWEEQYGSSLIENITKSFRVCNDSNKKGFLEKILLTLSDHIPSNPYTFHLTVVENSVVNAFAVPGGNILVFSGLLEQTDSPDELAGVLAHEIEHIVQHHSMREILRRSSTGLLVSALTFDSNGILSYGMEGANIMGSLKFNREFEAEADSKGIELLLRSQVNPEGMIKFFEKLKVSEKTSTFVPVYLSTHAATELRINKLIAIKNKSPFHLDDPFKGYRWNEIKTICRS